MSRKLKVTIRISPFVYYHTANFPQLQVLARVSD